MEHQKFAMMALRELEARSNININHDKREYVAMCGWEANFAPGCYIKKQSHPAIGDIPETLHIMFDIEPDRILEIMFHEMAHATGVRFGRPMHSNSRPNEYNKEEVLAELSSLKLLRHFGFSDDYTERECAGYIRKYSYTMNDSDMEEAQIGSDKAVEYILENWLPSMNEMYGKKAA